MYYAKDETVRGCGTADLRQVGYTQPNVGLCPGHGNRNTPDLPAIVERLANRPKLKVSWIRDPVGRRLDSLGEFEHLPT